MTDFRTFKVFDGGLAPTEANIPEPALRRGGGGGNSGGMEQIWAKLEEHDKRFDRLETHMQDVAKELSNAKFWFVGTALAIGLTAMGLQIAGFGLVYSARQDTTATIGAALTAIQTAVAVRPSEPAAPQQQQPIVIVVPSASGQQQVVPPASPNTSAPAAPAQKP